MVPPIYFLHANLPYCKTWSVMSQVGVPEAVAVCRTAGIQVLLMTGDEPLTAEALARKVGIVTLQTRREVAAADELDSETQLPWDDERVGAAVVTGHEVSAVLGDNDVAWDAVLDKPEVVFAATTPHQRLRIVEHLQRRGEVVAVAAEGVRDAPALKRAHVGIVMGPGGSSKGSKGSSSGHRGPADPGALDAADVVLLDGQFSSLVVAVEEGRNMFEVLKKNTAYTLTHGLPELMPAFMSVALGEWRINGVFE